MSDRDRVIAELGRLVEHLERRRDVGCPEAKTLGEQKRYRDGINVALRAAASTRLLLEMDRAPVSEPAPRPRSC